MLYTEVAVKAPADIHTALLLKYFLVNSLWLTSMELILL